MSRSLLLVFCLVIGLLILACGGPTNKNGTPTNSSGSESVAATPAATVAAADQIGVPECDNFLNAYETCITTKVPAAVRPGFQATMTTWRSEWKRMASDPQTRPALVTACQNHLETARKSMQQYGCTF
ncbi:MAG TPA: hypothetical protein VJP89_15180 [Pyrinomonadaceae bacterium]|nr:hypothetical protein [Pyrinomonadaceae bacterium]